MSSQTLPDSLALPDSPGLGTWALYVHLVSVKAFDWVNHALMLDILLSLMRTYASGLSAVCLSTAAAARSLSMVGTTAAARGGRRPAVHSLLRMRHVACGTMTHGEADTDRLRGISDHPKAQAITNHPR
jgi:hypothetical protein